MRNTTLRLAIFTTILATGGFLLAPGSLLGRQDVLSSVARGLKSAALRQTDWQKVVVFVHEEGSNAESTPPAEFESLAEQLTRLGRDAGLETIVLPSVEKGATATIVEPPDPAAWRDVLKQNNADGAAVVTWKAAKSSVTVRVTLLDGRKVQWTGRASLKKSQPSSGGSKVAQTSKDASTKAAGNGSGKQGSGAAAGSGNLGLANAAALSGGLPSGITGGFSGATGPATGSSLGGTAGSGAGGGLPGDLSDLNARIYQFARSALGQQVGNGQCYTLAVEALANAGAQASRGNDFGQELALSDLMPGDVLQFWSAKINSPKHGNWELGGPGHTAIVAEVSGLVVSVYHQNINHVPRVRQDVLDLQGLVSGQIIGYRALPRGSQ